ncbi:MAG: hypothetical protein DRH10_09540 [Deltaproteobacteria bacterium]|nr:MAG: hypothetical protein DRH10_09540 [Deltaproteobacteria bacterium]
MSEYRNELKRVSREAPYTAWTFLKWGLLVLLVFTILAFIAQALGIISINIQREVVQHSQQYVETKVNLLNKLHTDYLQLDAEIAELRAGEGNEEIIEAKRAQQKNIVTRMKTEAEMIPNSQVPASVKLFLSTRK